jgi:hypothetical protein
MNHTYGRDIDAHEAIFRANAPITQGFEEHVGSRTDVNFLNTFWYKHFFPGSMCKKGSLPDERRDMKGGVIIEREVCLWGFTTAQDIYESQRDSLEFVCTFDSVRSELWRWWHNKHFHGHPTTGFVMIVSAASMCDNVTVYGFSQEEAPLYHYYDATTGHPSIHDLNREHHELDRMAAEGIAMGCSTASIKSDYGGVITMLSEWLREKILAKLIVVWSRAFQR